MNRSFFYGDGFFETLRLEGGRPTLWSFHVDRIRASCDILRMNIPTDEMLEFILEEVMDQSNDRPIQRARLTIYRAGGGTYLPETSEMAYQVDFAPMEKQDNYLFPTHSGDLDQMISDISALDPITVGRYPDARKAYTPFAMIKSTSAQLYVAGAMYADEMGWDDAFIFGENGRIIETTRSNVYAVFDGKIYTPPITAGCVAGVCRAYLLDRYEILEAELSWEDLRSAELVFSSNALRGVTRINIAS